MEETSQCPKCHCRESRVLETREPKVHGYYLKIRRRVCRYCGHLFNTKEIVTDLDLPSSTERKKGKKKAVQKVEEENWDKQAPSEDGLQEADIIPFSPADQQETPPESPSTNVNPFL